MSDEDWLKSKDDSWIDDEKTRPLSLPGIALPGLRDLRIQFIALLEFDLFLGPVVHYNEIQRGSSYIARLLDHQRISETYAGVADTDVDELTTLEDSIAVFRFKHDEKAQYYTVLLISCIRGTDLDQVNELGKNALFKSKGNPEKLGIELSKYLREKLSVVKKFRSEYIKDKIIILDENRITKPLPYDKVKGLVIIDYQAKLADFRNFPTWVNGQEIREMDFVNYIDKLSTSIKEDHITSLIYQNNIILTTKYSQENLFVSIIIEEDDIIKLRKIGEWFLSLTKLLSTQWKFSSPRELNLSIGILNSAIIRGTIISDMENYIKMALRSTKLKPILNHHIDFSNMKSSTISDEDWERILTLDGNNSINTLVKEWNKDILELIPLLEWARIREIIIYFEE